MPLPEKEIFTLEEIIDRWRSSGCDHATLLDYARRDLLIFSVYLRDLGNHKRVVETDEARITTVRTTAFSFTSPGYRRDSVRYLKSEDARRILECNEGESAAISVLYSSPLRDKASGTGYLSALYFTPNDLLVTKAERDRFETEHQADLSGGWLTRSWTWLTESKNQKALTIMGSAVAAVALAVWRLFIWLYPKGVSP